MAPIYVWRLVGLRGCRGEEKDGDGDAEMSR